MIKRLVPVTGWRFTPPLVTDCASNKTTTTRTYCLSSSRKEMEKSKLVWIWTESKQVMTSAVERGWNTFIFTSQSKHLAHDWSCMHFIISLQFSINFVNSFQFVAAIALISPLFLEQGGLFDNQETRIAEYYQISSPEELNQFKPQDDDQIDNLVIDLLDWQVIPAENIVAAFQETQKTVFAISRSPSEAQTFFEALELGLGGVILKVEDIDAVLQLKDYVDTRNEMGNLLSLTKATITRVQTIGMGDRVCVDLCSLMRPGEGLLVGSFARGLFLVHSECLESNYIASRPFRVNAGPVHAYVAVPGGKTSYLSELQTGKEVLVVDQGGRQRTAIVGRVKIEKRPLILVEAKDSSNNQAFYSILLQNAETVGFVCPSEGNESIKRVIPVTSLKVGDEVLLRVQGEARHTGIEIQEFIVEK